MVVNRGFTVVVDEYLAELNDESTGVPDDANDIMDWVFGDEVFEGDEDYEGDKKISLTTNYRTPNIKMSMHHIQFVLSMF